MNSSLAVAPERAPGSASVREARGSAADDSAPEGPGTKDGPPALGNFHLASVMFLRAIQLKQGARPRVETNGHKIVHVAYLEVTAGAIAWESPVGPIAELNPRY